MLKGIKFVFSNAPPVIRFVRKAKLENLRFHDLRHTFATRLAQSGEVDIYKIAKPLGHKTLKMIQRYAHHCVESLRGWSKSVEIRLQLGYNRTNFTVFKWQKMS